MLGAAALILRSPATSWVTRLLGRDASTAAFYATEPMRLNITLTEDGELKPRESVDIKCEVEGQSTILFVVEESTKVSKGDLLVELASDTLVERLESEQMQLRKIEADLKSAEADLEIQQTQNASDIKGAEIDLNVARLDLEKYLKGDFPKQSKAIELDIKQTGMDISWKQEELQKNLKLKEKGFVTKMQVEQLEFALEKLEMTLQRHELSKEILLKYEHPKMEMQKQSAADRAREELDRVKRRAESRVERAQARVDQYKDQLQQRQRRCQRVEEQLKKCKMYAPTDGIVQYPSYGNWRWTSDRIAAGQKVHEGQTLLVLPDTSQMIASTRIHEADRHLVTEGLPCVVTVPAAPGDTFTGKIAKIDKFAESESRWLNPDLKEHGAEVLLDATEAALSPGDSAEVKILIDTIEDVLAVPVQCVFARGSRSFVFAQNGGTPEVTEVTLGRSNTNMIEIMDGLQPGDRVLMHADEGLLAKLPALDTTEVAVEELIAPKPTAPGEPARADKSKKKAATTKEPAAPAKAGAGGGESAATSGG